jgi:hypothetical protein
MQASTPVELLQDPQKIRTSATTHNATTLAEHLVKLLANQRIATTFITRKCGPIYGVFIDNFNSRKPFVLRPGGPTESRFNTDPFGPDLRDAMRCCNAYLLRDLGKIETGHIPCFGNI